MMLNLIVFFIYILLSVILTYPLVFKLGNSVANAIDPLLYVWNLNHNYQSIMKGFKDILDTNMFYPATNTLAYSDHLFGQTIILFPLLRVISNPLLVQNIYLFSTFIMASFGVYLLVIYLSKNYKSAFISGLIFGFSLYHFDHFGQMPTASIQWLPFSLLFLFKIFSKPSPKNYFLFWIFFTLNFLCTIYYGIFLSLAVFIFLLFKLKSNFRIIIRFFIYGIPFLILILLSLYPYILFHLENPEVRRTLEEAAFRSTNFMDFFVRNNFIHDRALFPGYAAVILTLIAIFFLKKSFAKIYFFLLLAVSFILSLGPEKWGLKLPYYYLYKLFPLMQSIRVPSRIGVLTILSFAVISGLMLARIEKAQLNRKVKRFIFWAAFLLIIIDSIHIPLKLIQVPTLSQAPEVYSWLAKQPDNTKVLELPLRSGVHSNHIEDQVNKNYSTISENDNFIAETFRLYFSIIHNKKMLNGYSSYFPPTYSEIATIMENFPSEESILLIQRRKVKYVIIHTRQYGARWDQIKTELAAYTIMTKKEDFGEDIIYSL